MLNQIVYVLVCSIYLLWVYSSSELFGELSIHQMNFLKLFVAVVTLGLKASSRLLIFHCKPGLNFGGSFCKPRVEHQTHYSPNCIGLLAELPNLAWIIIAETEITPNIFFFHLAKIETCHYPKISIDSNSPHISCVALNFILNTYTPVKTA